MRLFFAIVLSGSLTFLHAEGKAAAPASAPKTAKKVAAPAAKLMEGMLVSIDKSKQSFVVNLKGKEYAFQVTGASSISGVPGKKGIDALIAGSGVRVTYMKDAKGIRMVQTAASMTAAKPAPKAAAKPAPKAAAKPAPKAAAKPAPKAAVKPAPKAAAKPAPKAAAKPAPKAEAPKK